MNEKPTLIVPRRNFLVRALGFAASGATVTIPITTLANAKARIDHHRNELERAWRDYYGDARFYDNRVPVGTISPPTVERGRHFDASYTISSFMICSGGGPIDRV